MDEKRGSMLCSHGTLFFVAFVTLRCEGNLRGGVCVCVCVRGCVFRLTFVHTFDVKTFDVKRGRSLCCLETPFLCRSVRGGDVAVCLY